MPGCSSQALRRPGILPGCSSQAGRLAYENTLSPGPILAMMRAFPNLTRPMIVRKATHTDLAAAAALMAPLVARGDLLPRTTEELIRLLPDAFLAELDGRAVGFAALEVYSRKLSEIQCLSFQDGPAKREIVGRLADLCVGQAREHGVMEVLAIVPPPLEEILMARGFHVAPARSEEGHVRQARRGCAAGRPG